MDRLIAEIKVDKNELREICKEVAKNMVIKPESDVELTEPNTATSMPSGDAISRQAAIKAIEERAKGIKNEDTLNGLAGAVAILFDLPPVNPQEPSDEQVKEYCRRRDLVLVTSEFMAHIIKGAPQAYTYKGMTNEEVIKTIFPKAVLHTEDDDAYLSFQQGVYLEDKDATWLNAPYKNDVKAIPSAEPKTDNDLDMKLKLMEANVNGYAQGLKDASNMEQEPCEDVISRKALKHKLQEHHDFFVNAYGGFSNLPQNDKARVDEITNCIAMVVNEPPIKPQEAKWIPVSERLPEKNIWVLVTVVQGSGWYVETMRIDKYKGMFTDNIDYYDSVIAWMPLPKPYEPQERNEE